MDTVLTGLGLILVVALGSLAHDFIVALFLTVRNSRMQAARRAEVEAWEEEQLQNTYAEDRPDLRI